MIIGMKIRAISGTTAFVVWLYPLTKPPAGKYLSPSIFLKKVY
ncbi:hypothetical protein PROVALCAL_02889 [Providencia alcalifaciens DSM 30120]|uniref:Uncharacterized protein n=1 Tax=Providencia alcalifaciens DSM 30120 TaxID=520999 RepID=B6XHQ1_9GAMM|nr:hypothetical protein PROVALCAL_02889 [Providencia alcalifaciens DSM 30120]